jgi:hypothetical protein
MTPAEQAASFERLTRSGASVEVWNAWYKALAQPEPQQGAGPQRVDAATYEAMSPAERIVYARQFSRG